MSQNETTDILDRIADVHRQATTEQSHYYTAKVLEDSANVISALRATLLRIIVGCDELQLGGATKSGAWAAEVAKEALHARR